MQHHAHAALVEDRPDLLQARHLQAVRLVNHHEDRAFPNFAAASPVLLVCREIGLPLAAVRPGALAALRTRVYVLVHASNSSSFGFSSFSKRDE